MNSKTPSHPQVDFVTSKAIKLNNNKIPPFIVVIPKVGLRDLYKRFSANFSNRVIINPYAHPTALTVACALAPEDSYINSTRAPLNMGCRLQVQNGLTKTCRQCTPLQGRTGLLVLPRLRQPLDTYTVYLDIHY